MSLQQSKAEKNNAAPVRRTGGRGKSGASAAAHPPKGGVGGPSPHNTSNTSGKRQNGPGGQSRGNPNAGVSHSNAYAKVQNGGITQRQQMGSTSATSGSLPISTIKQSSVVGPKSNGILPKPPIVQPSNSKASEQTSSSSTAAVLGESTRAMAQQPLFQCGSFSPTGINGLQVPARTSSASPNFDEQKRDQACSGPPVDVSVSKTSTLSGTVQQLEGPTVLKQVASTIETTSEGNKILQGPKASPPFVQSQDATGGQIPSALPLRSNYPPSSQIQSHGATSGSRVTSSHPQSHGLAPVPRASSSHVQSQGAPSGPHAPSSQMQSQGVATEPHAPSYKYQSQGAISVPRGQSPQMQPQGGPHGLHGLSSQLQSQVLTTGLYAPNSQLQSQGVAPGSRSLQVQLQMPQVQQQVFSSQGLTAGALHSQGMLHHGLGYTQTLRHIIPQQTHVPSQQFIHTNHQINGQIPIQVTGSVGAHLPSYGPATQANQSVPQRTNPVKITHPETHEEIKIGPNVVKSDSHADGGIGTLVSDGCLPGGPPQYGTPHSGSVSISGLPQMSFYPTVSSGSYAHPPAFHQPPKITVPVRPNVARPSSMSNLPPVNLHGANVDTSKHPPHTTEASLAPVKASEGKALTSTISISQTSHSSNSSAIAASGREDTGNPVVSKSDVGAKRAIMNTPTTATQNHPDGNLLASSAVSSGEEQKSESVKSDVGAKRPCTNMPATATHNPSDGNVSNSPAVSAIEEQKNDSVKPVGVSRKHHSKKSSKLERKSKKHQQQASVPRTSTNAQLELKVEVVVDSSEVSGSADASKSGLCQAKQKKQQQQPLLRSSSSARFELKEVVPELSEVSSSCSVVPLVTAPSKTVKSVDGGAGDSLINRQLISSNYSLARVAEKESKSSLNAFSNNKITNTADVPKTVGNKKKKKLKITNTADVPKTVGNKKKKKLKDYLSKADAAAPTGDLYNAYKVPEKQEDVNSAEPCKEDSTDVEEKPSLKETQKHVPNEVDDWEDAAELSTNIEQVVLPMTDSNCSGDRKYSRDFLLTFKEHFKDLPLQFEMCQDFGDSLINRQLISSNYSEGEPLTSTGRGPEYSRLDRRGSNVSSMDEDRWLKPMDAGSHDLRVEMGLGAPGGFRPGQGYNTGFGKNMRGAAPGVGPSGQFVQAPFGQSGPMRNNIADVDRWRTSGMQEGLIPPTIIHKTDNRYEVGKVSDEEESKQRKIKSILNKLTPQNFETLFLRVQEVNIDSAVCLTGVISQIFDKALMEPTFCEMYAKFCVQLAAGLPEFYEDNERVMFRRVLLNKCQEKFERDEREQAEAQMPEDGEIKVSKEEQEGKRSAQRRRMLAFCFRCSWSF